MIDIDQARATCVSQVRIDGPISWKRLAYAVLIGFLVVLAATRLTQPTGKTKLDA
jgi:hypothetical protein